VKRRQVLPGVVRLINYMDEAGRKKEANARTFYCHFTYMVHSFHSCEICRVFSARPERTQCAESPFAGITCL